MIAYLRGRVLTTTAETMILDVNGVAMEYSDADLISLGLGMADGTLDYEDVLGWIHKHKTGELSQPNPT